MADFKSQLEQNRKYYEKRYVAPTKTEPAPLPVTPPPVVKTDSVGLWDTFKSTLSSAYETVNRGYIQPLRTLEKEDSILGTSLDNAVSFGQAFAKEPLLTALDLMQAGGRTIIKGASLGYLDPGADFPEINKPKSTFGKEHPEAFEAGEATGEFVQSLIPWVGAERLALGAFKTFGPKFMAAHPKLVKNFVDYTTWTGVGLAHKDVLAITPEEEAEGVTLFDKVNQSVLGSSLFLTALKGSGFLLSKAGSAGKVAVDSLVKDITTRLENEAAKSVTKKVPNITVETAPAAEKVVNIVKQNLNPIEEVATSPETFIARI